LGDDPPNQTKQKRRYPPTPPLEEKRKTLLLESQAHTFFSVFVDVVSNDLFPNSIDPFRVGRLTSLLF